jgi:hypothetical protein
MCLDRVCRHERRRERPKHASYASAREEADPPRARAALLSKSSARVWPARVTALLSLAHVLRSGGLARPGTPLLYLCLFDGGQRRDLMKLAYENEKVGSFVSTSERCATYIYLGVQ